MKVIALAGFLLLAPSVSNSEPPLLENVRDYINPDGTIKQGYIAGSDTVRNEGRNGTYIWRKYLVGKRGENGEIIDGKELHAFYKIGKAMIVTPEGVVYPIDGAPCYYDFDGRPYADPNRNGISGDEKFDDTYFQQRTKPTKRTRIKGLQTV